MIEFSQKIKTIQNSLHHYEIDGWLFFDCYNRDPIAQKVLGLDPKRYATRRWCYLIPSKGVPTKLVHSIEKEHLEELPGKTILYSSWIDLHTKLTDMLRGSKRLAMQYSPCNDIPRISYIDAGLLELIKSFNIEVVSSANLIQLFVAKLSDENIALHKQAGEKIQLIKDRVFKFIFTAVKNGARITEYEAQQFILREFVKENLTSEGLDPIVAVNSHAANPHFQVTPTNTYEIKKEDRILVDLWAKMNVPNGVYYDITWCGYVGKTPPNNYLQLFDTVVQARNLTKNFVIKKIMNKERVFGYEVDDVCRNYISQKGYGQYFTHRTGHSIDTSLHGSGVNIDNFETRDYRELMPGLCFSIEPGIYKDALGVRSEINVLITYDNTCLLVGPEQKKLVLLDDYSNLEINTNEDLRLKR